MDDLNLRFSTDSDRSGETGETENATRPLEEKTERASDEPTTATDAAPAMSPDEADRRRPVAQASTLRAALNKGPSALAKARIKAESLHRNSRPLAVLANKEAELRDDSEAAAKLSKSEERRPDPELLIHQLVSTVSTRFVTGHKRSKMKSDAVGLYSALRPRNPIDSIRARIIVGLNNAIMDCLERAAQTSNEVARNVNLRHSIKGAAVLTDLLQQYESRRGGGTQTVKVGKVNVEAGGQAIVGNVKTGDRRKRATKSKSTRSPRPQRATPKRRQG